MAEYTAQVPKIAAAVLLPNPATINGKVKLQVTVIEESVIVYPSYYYSGDLYAGESPIRRTRVYHKHIISFAAIFTPGRYKWQSRQ